MRSKATKRVVVLCIIVLASLLAAGAAFAQDVPAPLCVPDDVTSCVKIVFSPAALVGDLYTVDSSVDPAVEVPTAQVQQNTLWVTFTNPAPGMSANVVVKNIHDGAADNGPLYIYPDTPKSVTAPAAGKTTTVTLFLTKKYIAGKVDAKCSPNAVVAGEDVGCTLTIDGVLVEGLLMLPGQKTTFVMAPGAHSLQFDLVGVNAALWTPASQTKPVTVTAGAFPKAVTASFLKSTHLVASLAKAAEGWVGDFYVDGTLVAPQVGSIDTWVAANKTHKVEVKNIALATAPLLHPYKDGSSSFYATTGSNKVVSVPMTAQPTSAFLAPYDFCSGLPNFLTNNSLVMLQFSWPGLTKEIADYAGQHIQIYLSLDGVNVGDLNAYRKPAVPINLASLCGIDEASETFYIVNWFVPLGKLAAGTHSIHVQMVADSPITDGIFEYPPGVLIEGDGTFEVYGTTP